jgi:hypothetical protein
MGPRRRWLLIGVGGHFAVVAANVAGVDFWSAPASSPVARCANLAIAEYGALSGAESQYGYFAPGVDDQLRLVFEMTEPSGRVRTDVLSNAVNAEVDLRVANLVSLLWQPDEGLHRALETSWATAMFDRHPSARRVAIEVQVYELPSMDGMRRGRRPVWRVLDRVSFSPPCRATGGLAGSAER